LPIALPTDSICHAHIRVNSSNSSTSIGPIVLEDDSIISRHVAPYTVLFSVKRIHHSLYVLSMDQLIIATHPSFYIPSSLVFTRPLFRRRAITATATVRPSPPSLPSPPPSPHYKLSIRRLDAIITILDSPPV